MSICTSCGRQRDSCDICGGDLADAGVYCNARKAERDALAAEGRLLREALLEWKFVTQSMASPDLIDAMEQGYEALNATPLTAAEVERMRKLEAGAAVAWDALNVAHIVGPSEAIKRARTALHDVLVSNLGAQSVADDSYGRTERGGDYQLIKRGVIQATVFVHSCSDARDSISEVDLCEVSGSVPMDFLLWWEDRRCAEDVTECFEAVRSELAALDEAYVVEVGYAWTWRGDHDYDYGWLIERVTPLGTLYPYRGGE